MKAPLTIKLDDPNYVDRKRVAISAFDVLEVWEGNDGKVAISYTTTMNDEKVVITKTTFATIMKNIAKAREEADMDLEPGDEWKKGYRNDDDDD